MAIRHSLLHMISICWETFVFVMRGLRNSPFIDDWSHPLEARLLSIIFLRKGIYILCHSCQTAGTKNLPLCSAERLDVIPYRLSRKALIFVERLE